MFNFTQHFIGLSLILCIMMACENPKTSNNPFFESYDTPFEVPPFDRIRNEHFLPALKEGIRQHQEEINAIKTNPDPATFENTVEALDYAGFLLKQVRAVFFNFNAANTSDEIQAIARDFSPLLSEHVDNLTMDSLLFDRVKEVYEQKETLVLSEEQRMLLKEVYKDFINNGASLSSEEQARFREINSELSLLRLQFQENVLADVNAFRLIIEDEDDLSGLPLSLLDLASERAEFEGMEGKWVFTLHNQSVMPFLSYADKRSLREKMNRAYILRGANDNEHNNEEVINRMLALRLERVKMLGYDDYASYALKDRMAGDVLTVQSFLDQLWDAALPIAQQEADELQALIRAQGDTFSLQYWDWRYYAEQLRKDKYDLEEEALRPYFELNHVRDGIFLVVEKLWGLQFSQRKDLPVYHPDVTAWEVMESDGEHLGILYMDMHPRPGKRGGAWMSSFRPQYKDPYLGSVSPIITIVCNFTEPIGKQPSLLSFEEVTTFFHEFGHALHGLMSNTQYYSLSGTSVPRDFVELPSQLMENWAKHPDVLRMFARHYQSGETIPDALLDKMQQAAYFNQGFATVEFLASALLDMDYHTKSQYQPFSISTFEGQVQARYKIPHEIYFRHGSTHFQHIFAGGYAAGYYSYIWSGILDADAFEAFVETADLFDFRTAERFRTEILERGGSREAMEMYKAFRGREPRIEPLLRQRGLMQP